MKTLTTKRLIKSGFTNFFRNILVSIAATSMVAITLVIISTILVLYTLAVISKENASSNVGVVTAYFNSKTTPSEMKNVQTEIEAIPNVKSVVFVSTEEANAKFRELHQNQPWILQSLDEFENKALPASLSINVASLDTYEGVYNAVKVDRYQPYFSDDHGVSTVKNNQQIIDNLQKVINFITKFGIVLAGIFMIVTILVTFNTIRLTIYNRREEVEIMRLVGATNWYIRWPFIIEAILYALFATVVTALITFGLLLLLSNRIEQFLSLGTLGQSLVRALFWRILVVDVIASLGLTIIASTIAIRKYLKI